MNAATELVRAWGSYSELIDACLRNLSEAKMPDEADFLWFVLMPQELCGMPVIVWPTDRDQQQYDGWHFEEDLMECVPEEVELPDLADTPENVERLRDACGAFLVERWQSITPMPDRLAYFSLSDDGWYLSLRDGRRVSAWEIGNEISEQVAAPDR
ncbi:hypothetical protein HW115_19160 [Verrucomicrobiaceae bacterium N1E253]|uniref:Uncharacterized protein n=1 Tax=Oceaniferula marina TaxID=2748318 RepID=A0A851GK79_9BACT|nr:hypothetical protein [Oceaniferula marina]NWK57746.1 hypothetical protein [Oceaniferula marina]